MLSIKLLPITGSFAENKDLARNIRKEKIVPVLEGGREVCLDFEGIESATQSFIHALISELIRVYGDDVIDKIIFKNCNGTVQKIINIVIDYMQERD